MAKKLTADQLRYRDRVIECRWLKGNKCAHCGKKCTKWSDKFEFDHIDAATKEFNISDFIKSVPMEEVLGELEKCQLLCKECHLNKTAPLRGRNHGVTGYRTGCRCDTCKAGNRDLQRRFREKKKIIGV